jgi:uncharacterized protein YaeQ
MILLLIALAWIVALWLVAGLCAAARLGDVELDRRAAALAGSAHAAAQVWEPQGRGDIAAHANVYPVHRADASQLHSDGVAA